MTCELCDIIKSKTNVLFEDEKVVVALAPKPATIGHILVMPKEHFPILEQVPDFVASELFVKANKVSIGLFETLKIEGTNMIIQNGTGAGQNFSHCSIQVIPRVTNDGMNLLWKPKQLSEEEMATVELKVKDETKLIGEFEKEKPKPKEVKETPKLSKEEDYLIKHLKKRLP